MSEIFIENHNQKLKDLIFKRRLWNIFIIISLLIAVLLSSSIIDINSSRLLNGLPRLGDYISQILPSLDSSSFFLDSNKEGSIAYWYFNLPKYLKLLFETFNMALLATVIGSSIALLFCLLYTSPSPRDQ